MDQIVHFFFNSTSTRQVIFSIPNVIIIYRTSEIILKRVRKPYLLFSFWTLRLFLFYVFEYFFLVHPELSATTYFPYIVYSMWRDLLAVFFYVYTYSDDICKGIFTVPVLEMLVSAATTPAIIVVNLIEKQENLTILATKFMWPDLLIPVLAFIIWKIVKIPLQPLFLKYRKWKPAHGWVLVIIFLFYYLLASTAYFRNEYTADGNRMYYAVHLSAGMIAAALLLFWTSKRNREEAYYSEYQAKRLRQMQEHYSLLRMNRKIAEEKRDRLNQWMKSIEENTAQTDMESGKYLAQLKEDYQTVKSGLYCEDLEVDAVLYTEASVMERRGFQTDIRVEQYDPGKIKSEIVATIVMLCCEEWLGQNEQEQNEQKQNENTPQPNAGSFRLRISSVKKQLLISCNVSKNWNRKRYRILKQAVNQAKGSILFEKDPEKCIIMIPET